VRTEAIINQLKFIEILSKIENIDEISKIKSEIQKIIDIINAPRKMISDCYNNFSNGGTIRINKQILLEDLNQI
jgi:hypothetical protein